MEGLAHAIRALRGERTQVAAASAAGIDATTWSFYVSVAVRAHA